MSCNPFKSLPRDILREIVDLLEPLDYFRVRKAFNLEKVLRRYLVVSASMWLEVVNKYTEGVNFSQLVRSRPPLCVQERVVDILESFRIDPRTLSRRTILMLIAYLGTLIRRDQILAHIGYSTYPLDRNDSSGSSFFLWKSIAPYIHMLGAYMMTMRSPTQAHYLVPGFIADYVVMSAIIMKDVRLMRVLMVQFWYLQLRYDLLYATAIAARSWRCLEDLFDRNQNTDIALKIISSFENGPKWDPVIRLLVRAIENANEIPPRVIVAILCHYWSSKDVICHDFWKSLQDDEIALVMEALVNSRKQSKSFFNQAKFLLTLPNANHTGNPHYLSAAIQSGSMALMKYLAKVGHAYCSEEWVQACAIQHPSAKRRKIKQLLGFTVEDTFM